MISFKEFLNEAINFEELFESNLFNDILLESIFINEIAKSEKIDEIQPWFGKFSLTKSDIEKAKKENKENEIDERIKKFLDEYAQDINKKFVRKLTSIQCKNNKIMTNLKSVSSIKDKILRGKDIGKMTDIIRGSILVKDEKDIPYIMEQMKKKFHIYELDVKEKGNNEWGYYGSFHYLVDIDGTLCEVQIMTKKLFTFKELGHEIYDKWRTEVKLHPELKNTEEYKKAMKMSKMVFSQGNISK